MPLSGECSVPTNLHIEVGDQRVRGAVERWLAEVRGRAKPAATASRLVVGVDPDGPADNYQVQVKTGEIRVRGGGPAGCFYGLQTLRQLAGSGAFIPCCEIIDQPDFSVRGLLHDTTRGKVPKLSTLKLLADRLASLKINQLQLYIEHSFVFDFDPSICDERNGLTADEIRELDQYCRERFIDLVPAVATLGHMGRVLSLPRYRHLAEIPPSATWEELSWPLRARGLTLDILNSESHRLVERIWTEILDAFSSPVVNICGDEPWDLARGRNKDILPSAKVAEAYVDSILRTHAICAQRGRRTQVWSDVVRNHPELFVRLPRDLTVLHWGYDDRSDYAGTKSFVEAGLSTVCCPGTTGWKRVLNAMELAERNIATFAEAGRNAGAIGLINTDWGDHGHFNALACSWHGIALGAARAWDARHVVGREFDARFASWLFDSGKDAGRAAHEWVAVLRAASASADACETWRLLWQPLAQIKDDTTLPALETSEAVAHAARSAIGMMEELPPGIDRDELQTACVATLLFCDKVRLARGGLLDRNAARERVESLTRQFSRNWNTRNKPSGLGDIEAALARVRTEFE